MKEQKTCPCVGKTYVFKYREQRNVHVTHEGFVHPRKKLKEKRKRKTNHKGCITFVKTYVKIICHTSRL